MATSHRPDADKAAEHTSPLGEPPAAAKRNQADFYDTQFIVGRLKADQRKTRFRFYMAVALLAIVIVGLYTLTARRAEAPQALKTDPVVVPAPSGKTVPTPQPTKKNPAAHPPHK